MTLIPCKGFVLKEKIWVQAPLPENQRELEHTPSEDLETKNPGLDLLAPKTVG